MDVSTQIKLSPLTVKPPTTRWKIFSWIMFCTVAGIFVVSSVVCLIAVASWVNRPFAGFVMFENMMVDRPGPVHWTGSQAGIQFPDTVVTINGHSVQSLKDFDDIIKSLPVGARMTYAVRRAGQSLELQIPTMEFTWADAAMKFGIMFMVGQALFALGLLVFILKPHTEVSWVFFGTGVLFALDFINIFDYMSEWLGFAHLLRITVFLLPAMIIHLSIVFPGKVVWRDKAPWLIVLPYGLSFAFIIGHEKFYHNASSYDALHHFYVMYLGMSAMALLSSIAMNFFVSRSVLIKARGKVLLFGAILALPIPAITTNLRSHGASLGGIPTAITIIPLLLFPAAIAYAIIKHNLFDVDAYIKRTVGYVIMTALVASGYFALDAVVKTAILDPLLGDSSERVYPFIFALLTVVAFGPLSKKVQTVVDKVFFRKPYDYKITVASISDALTSVLDIKGFLSQVIQTIRRDMYIDQVGVILADNRQKYESIFQGGAEHTAGVVKDRCLDADDPLLTLLATERRLITKYDIAEDPRFVNIRMVCGQRFSELGASLVLPLFCRNEFTGMMALGYKKSGHFYTREDVDLLRTLSSMASTAIEQSREKGQRAVLMQLFSKHVSPQVAESLWNQREQFLDGGRPKSQKFIVSAMFTDLQGFSTVSEKQDPQVLMDWLNTYMEMVTRTVMEHGGVVDDFFGDGVKVNFGVPIPRTTEEEIRQDAVNAVTCALRLEREMKFLNERMKAQGNETLRMRVGIYTGPVVAGSLGSADRMKYTTLGDAVNTAARLESYDKSLVLPHLEISPCRILIGESTLRYIGEAFQVQKVGELELKGKSVKIGAYCVLGFNGPLFEDPTLASLGR